MLFQTVGRASNQNNIFYINDKVKLGSINQFRHFSEIMENLQLLFPIAVTRKFFIFEIKFGENLFRWQETKL